MRKIFNFHPFDKLRTTFNSQKGFTLVELLIVIAILGILSTAVLSAINPVEQINRGRDTGTQSDSEQLLSAVQRFNANQGYYPWQTGASDTTVCTGVGSGTSCTGLTRVFGTLAGSGSTGQNPAAYPAATGGWTVDNANFATGVAAGVAGSNVLAVLGSGAGGQQELLTAYLNRITATGYNYLYVYNGGSQGNSTYICFKPQSNSFKATALKRWNNGTACTGAACTCTGVPADLLSSSVCDTTANNTNTLYCLP